MGLPPDNHVPFLFQSCLLFSLGIATDPFFAPFLLFPNKPFFLSFNQSCHLQHTLYQKETNAKSLPDVVHQFYLFLHRNTSNLSSIPSVEKKKKKKKRSPPVTHHTSPMSMACAFIFKTLHFVRWYDIPCPLRPNRLCRFEVIRTWPTD